MTKKGRETKLLVQFNCNVNLLETETKEGTRINSERRRYRALLSDKQCFLCFVWDGFLLEVGRPNTSQQSTESCNQGLNVLQQDYRVQI